MNRRRLAPAIGLAVGVALLLVPVPGAGAAAVAGSGWWYRTVTATPTAEVPQPIPGGHPTVPVTAPGPPTVPAGMLHVQGVPAGATAIAAVTFTLAEGETSPVLTITPDATSVIPPGALILACRAAVEWVPPASLPGAWETKPLVDCSRSVQAQPGDGGKLVFPLQPLLDETLLDVVIVPGMDPTIAATAPEAAGSVFSLTFATPTVADLVTTPGLPPTSSDFGSDFSSGSDVGGSFGSGDSGGSGSFGFTPAGDLSLAPVDAPVRPALDPQDQAPAVPRVAAPVANTTPVDTDDVRTLGMLVIAGCALTAWLSSQQAAPATVGLGRFAHAAPAHAEVEERGLGRLRRARSGPPPSL